MKAYSRIAESLGRFRLLEMSFQGQPQLYPVFVVFYADILRFHKAAYKSITRRCEANPVILLPSLLPT